MLIKSKNVLIVARELLALALLEVFPQSQICETYQTDLGFGLDSILTNPLDECGFHLIEETFQRLLLKEHRVESLFMMRENAAELFIYQKQNLLAERVLSDSNNVVSLVRVGDFYGYSRLANEHLSTQALGAVKLIAYEQVTPKITSLEGVVCNSAGSLKKWLKKYKTAKKNDHQILGPQLKLFFHPKNAAKGCWSWLPKGETLKEILLSVWKKKHLECGFSSIKTSNWLKEDETKTTPIGLFAFCPVETNDFVKNSRLLGEFAEIVEHTPPLRFMEITDGFLLQTGKKSIGLFNALAFTQDLAYTICPTHMVEKELISSLQFLSECINIFAIEHRWYLVGCRRQKDGRKSSRDHNFDLLEKALKTCRISYEFDLSESCETKARIEARFIDSIEREWSGPWIRLSEKGSDKKQNSPVVIFRSFFGSLERFIAILLERYTGHFPLWLAPEQVRVIPVKKENQVHAAQVHRQLSENQIRASLNFSDESLRKKIYAAKAAKIPYTVVLGDCEQSQGTIAVQSFKGDKEKLKLDAFILKLKQSMNPDCVKNFCLK